jgi:hypothetical protein
MTIIKTEKVALKNNPKIKEEMIQSFIFDDPTVLGLGDLSPIQREKIQPAGGRLDLLFGDDNGTRYEVEIQLGATDPSHIIRTIEYWDTERKRYPQYDHCAVIVAEEITGRFMNVISLFNGAIPLVALQVTAYKIGNDISLAFTKVLDRISLGIDEEEQYEVTDRNYWEKRSTPKMLKSVDEIFENLKEFISGYEMKYNKFYIGVAKDGMAKNFVSFQPKKNYLYLIVKGDDNSEKIKNLEDIGLDVTYQTRWKQYRIRLNVYDEYKKHKEILNEAVKDSMAYFDIAQDQY